MGRFHTWPPEPSRLEQLAEHAGVPASWLRAYIAAELERLASADDVPSVLADRARAAATGGTR